MTPGCCSSPTQAFSVISAILPASCGKKRPRRLRRRPLVRRASRMSDFLAALGLVFIIEGLIFAAFPEAAKRAMTSVLETPDVSVRLIGVGSALVGLIVVWLVRG